MSIKSILYAQVKPFPFTKGRSTANFLIVRKLSFIVLLLWTVCYGRCLAEQYGAHETTALGQTWCSHRCCHQEKPDMPLPAPLAPCGLCAFFKSGGALPDSPASLNVPVFYWLPVPESGWFTASTVMLVPSPELEGQNIVPPRVPRMCEWMVSTAAPVRGPNPCA